jgi:hypothetical protein
LTLRKLLESPQSPASRPLPRRRSRADRVCRGASYPDGMLASNRRACAAPTELFLRPCQSPFEYKCATCFESATHLNLSQVDESSSHLPSGIIGSPALQIGLASYGVSRHSIWRPRSNRVPNGISEPQAMANGICEHLLARCRIALCAPGRNGVGFLQGFLLHCGSMPDRWASSSKDSCRASESNGLRTRHARNDGLLDVLLP